MDWSENTCGRPLGLQAFHYVISLVMCRVVDVTARRRSTHDAARYVLYDDRRLTASMELSIQRFLAHVEQRLHRKKARTN